MKGFVRRAWESARAPEPASRRAVAAAARAAVEALEGRQLFVASFDVTHLTDLRADQKFVDVDGSDVAIAVLDTGVYGANPDLQPNLVAFYNAVSDPVDTPLLPDSASAAFDTEGHGTHVAGIAASTDPNTGVAYAAKLVGVKVLADGGEKQLGGSALVRGLKWVKLHATDLNIKVVNMSLGTGANLDAVTTALARTETARAIDELEALGITVVASSGNSYAQYAAPGVSPEAAVSTISVANTWAGGGRPEDFDGAVGRDGDRFLAVDGSAAPDRFAAASQRGTLANQLVAPGQDVLSTWNGLGGGTDGGDGLHKVQSGTSMSAPFVSGLVALMQDAAKTFGGQYLSDPNQILKILQDTADTIVDSDVPDNKRYDTVNGDLSDLPETGLSYKRVNAAAAIKRVFDVVTAGSPGPDPDTGNEADANNVRGRATVVPTLNATRSFNFTGSVGFDGQLSVGDNDVDLFRINLQTRGNLTVETTPIVDVGFPVDITIRLFDAAGKEVASASGDPITFDYPILRTDPGDPLDTGIYYVGISGINNVNYDVVTGNGAADGFGQGDYSMTLSLQNPDPNGVVQGAVDVDLTNPDEQAGGGQTFGVNREVGLLGSDRPFTGTTDRVAVDADVDMYRVLAPDTGVLEVDIEAQAKYGNDAADTYVKVYDEDLVLLGENDNEGNSATNEDSRLSVPIVRGGIYYVAVTVSGNRRFDARDPYKSRTANTTPTDKSYDLRLWATNGDANGSTLSATDLNPGDTVTGGIGKDVVDVGDGTAPSKDVDWFKVRAPSDGLLEFKLAGGGGFVPSLSLWELDPTGDQIVKIDEEVRSDAALSLPVTAGRVIYAAVTGTGNTDFNWLAVASGSGGATGAYTLDAQVRAVDATKALTNGSVKDATPTPISLGQTIAANLGRDGDVIVGAADLDLYKYVPTDDVAVRVRTLSNAEEDADTVLRLFDADGKEIASNDNATVSSKSSRVTASLRKGQTYYVGVTGAGPGSLAYDPLAGADVTEGAVGRYSVVVEALSPGSASLTFDRKNPGVFTDVDGNRIVLKLSGNGIGQLEVDGANPDSFILTIDDTDIDSVVSVKGRTTFGDVNVNGPLKAFKGSGVRLRGDFKVEGSLASLQLASADVGSGLSGTLIGNVKVGGDFGATLAVSGDLGSFKSGGNLVGGAWSVAGGVRSMSARDAAAAWSAEFGGQVGPVKLDSLSGSTFSAGLFDAIAVKRGISGATITTALGGIGSVSAKTLEGTTIRSAGDIEKVTADTSTNSTIFAGVADDVTTLPTAGTAFVNFAAVRSVTVKRGPFGGTRIAATEVGKVTLKSVEGDNAGTPFGIATTSLDQLVVGKTRTFRKGDDPIVLTPVGDFRVTLLPAPTEEPPTEG